MALDPRLQTLAAPGSRDASSWLDVQGLQQLKAGDAERRPENVRAVAQQFEQLFLGMMLKSMRDAKLADGAMEGEGTRLYQDLYDKQVTLQMSQGRGLGIADLLVRQLAPAAAAAAVVPPTGDVAGVEPLPALPAPHRPRPSNPKFGAAELARAYESMAASTRRAERPAGAAGPAGFASIGAAAAPAAAADVFAAAAAEAVPAASQSRADPGRSAAEASAGGAARRFADSPEEFVRKVLPHARAAAAELGVPPAAIVAQAALETGWGRHVPAGADGTGHNLFGIKAGARWAGARLGRATVEIENGLPVRTQAAFRAYESVAAGFRDYVALLRTSERYAAARGVGDDAARFAQALQAGGYATDPQYARKLLQIVNGSTLRDAMAAASTAAAPAQLALNSGAPLPIT